MANTTNRTTRIKHVYGNVLKLAIPLTLRTVTLEGGIVEVTDTDYTPSNHYPVVVQFVNGPLKYELDATIRDNYIAVVEDKGTIPVGNYAIVVLCKDDNGDPRRFKQRCVLEVVDVTADAGIEVGIEFEAQEWLLDGAIFLAIKGEDGIDGVGIESITTDETSVSGEYNQVTFHLTNGSSYTLNVRNGESTEQTLPANVVVDENYVHTDNNYTDTDKQKIESVDKLFADAEYDRISRRLNFFKHGDTMHTNPLKSIDITDFIRDSRVSSFRIVDGNLTIKLNSDGNNEEFKVPISRIFNHNNYYTKEQTDAKLSQKVNLDATTGRVDASQATRVVLDYIVGIYDGEDEPSHDVNAGDVWYDNGQIYYAYNNDVIVVIISLGAPQKDIIYCNAENNKLYRWNGSEFVQVGGSGSGSGGYEPPVGGIPKTDLASDVQTSLGKADTALQSSDLEGYATTDDVDDAVAALVSSAPQTLDTLNELAEALGDDPNFATTMATQLGNKVDKESGKGLSTNDYTTAEKTKLAGLENYDDSALQTAIDGKVDKESGKSLMTDAERTKLQGIAAGAEVNVQPNWTQTNTSADDYIKNKPTLATVATSGSYNDLQDKPTIPAAQVQSDWNATSGMGVILNKPTIPTVDATLGTSSQSNAVQGGAIVEALAGKENTLTWDSAPTSSSTNPVTSGGVYTALQSKQDTIIDLSTIRTNSGKGVVDISSQEDGTVDIELANGDTYTLVLNHDHTQYLAIEDIDDYVTAGTNVTITKDSQTGVLEISASGGSSGVTGITMNGSDVTISSGVAQLGTVLTSQTKANWTETNSSSDAYIQNKPNLATVATSGAYSDLSGTPTIPTNVSSFTNDAGYTTNTGTITGITMNGASKGTSGVVDLGTVVTDVSGKANTSEMSVSTSGDQTTITLKSGTSATVINQHQSLSGYAKYVLLANEAAYTALATKDSGTLYLIPES